MNILEKLWAKPLVKATVERMWRGGVVAVAAAYAGGQLDLNGINPDTITTAVGIFISGAIASLLLASGVTAVTGSPAINRAESFETPISHRRRNQNGQSVLWVVLVVVLILLLLFLLTPLGGR